MDDMDIDEAASALGEDLINQILEAQPLDVILKFLDDGAPVWYQNVTEGISPLHAAAYIQNAALVKLLIEKGAVWNAVDYLNNTAGEIALSFNNEEIYTLIRDAGIRSELLLGILSKQTVADPASLILRSEDITAAGSSTTFLDSKLKYTTDRFGQEVCLVEVDGDDVGVMMGWEREIMRETVQKLCQGHPKTSRLRVLNVGFGLGIIDSFFQQLSTPPEEHVIIEAHPDVLAYMKSNGWYGKKGVRILEGKWQDFIDKPEFMPNGGFDVIYTDTFSEDYNALQDFFSHLSNLMADTNTRFSFFNGLGATNALFYDVYTRISEIHLAGFGVDVEWSDVDVTSDGDGERWAKSREYFSLPLYRLPIGKLK
ncbi:arginine methyl transferase [Crepidotus variabilis]|uniref:Arginine methyl transferase n=1 Tax=Crepidotus variabilis TaxID=179855 RepID=A0A9P6EHT4_9AGAR|nr:arginine methyl transferase [Crepidotus variabilis]